MRVSVSLLVLALGACQSRGTEPGARSAAVAAPNAELAELPASGVNSAPSNTPYANAGYAKAPFVDALRDGDWANAARLFDATYPQPSEPELRFVRARMAAQLGDAERTLDLLNGLVNLLPIVAREIRELEAEANLKLGRYQAALQYYAEQSGNAARLKEAETRRKNAETDAARRLLEALLADKRLETSLRAPTLIERFELALQLHDAPGARKYLTTLLLDYPLQERVWQSEVVWLKALPGFALSKEQILKRAEVVGKAGKLERFEQLMAAIKSAPGTVPAARIKRARAWALYQSRSQYSAAAKLFEECAREDASQPDQDLYFTARAWSRADEDEKARKLYAQIATRFEKSKYADLSRYQRARLHYLHASWRDAIRDYDTFLKLAAKRVPEERRQARYERAVALLAATDYRRAREEFDALVRDGDARQLAWNLHLSAVSSERSGDVAAASRDYQRVIGEAPLSFAALMSATRLSKLASPAALPPPMPPNLDENTHETLSVSLPERAALFEALGLSADAETALAERADAISKQYAPRGGEAVCSAYAKLSAAGRRYRYAQNLLGSHALDRALTERTRWAWDCSYPTPYIELAQGLEKELSLPSWLLHSVMRQESAFLVNARSSPGATGLMQLMPATAAGLDERLAKSGDAGADLPLTAPARNLRLGAHYIAQLLKRFDGQVPFAVAAYNAGPEAVKRWATRGKDLPLDLWVAFIGYGETREYVQRVLGNWARYSYLARGENGLPAFDLKLQALAIDGSSTD